MDKHTPQLTNHHYAIRNTNRLTEDIKVQVNVVVVVDLLLFPHRLSNDEHVVKQEQESLMRLKSLQEAIKEESDKNKAWSIQIKKINFLARKNCQSKIPPPPHTQNHCTNKYLRR